jgi:hypothetical protein
VLRKWFKAPTPAPERRPASADDLRLLESLSKESFLRRGAYVSLLGAGFALTVAIIAFTWNPPTAVSMPLAVTAFAVSGLCFLAFIIIAIIAGVRASRAAARLKIVDPLLSPVVPYAEGDRVGEWVVIDSDRERLHVARATPLPIFRLRRFSALIAALAVAIGLLATAYFTFVPSSSSAANPTASHANQPTKKKKNRFNFTMIKFAAFAFFGAAWLVRFGLARSAYQWTLEPSDAPDDDILLVMQDEALFRRPHLVTVDPAEIANFAASPTSLAIILQDGTVRDLAGLGGGPLAPWRAACLASTIASLLDIRVPLVFTDSAKQVSTIQVPSDIAEDAELSPSTTGLTPKPA